MKITIVLKRVEKIISTDIVEEILQVFLEYYLYIKKIDLDLFIEKIHSQKWTVSKLNQYIFNIRHDPYTKLFKFTKHSCETSFEYLDLLNGTIYIKICDFYNIENITIILRKKKYKHLIIDLAENIGGYVKNAIYLASLLISQDVLVELKYREKSKILRRENVYCINIPKVTLCTSEKTVSCGEIFTFLIMEFHNNCMLIGRKTHGKNSGQITWDNKKYKIRFVITAYNWYINGMNCEMLQEKYKKCFSDIEYNRELFFMNLSE